MASEGTAAPVRWGLLGTGDITNKVVRGARRSDRVDFVAVGSRTLVCEDGRLESHPSGWAEYQRRRDEEEAEAEAAAKPRSSGGRRYSATKPAQKAARKAAKLEERIERAEAELREIEDELSDPAAWSSPGQVERATKRHEEAKAAVEELYREWEAAQAEAEAGSATA